MHLSKEDAVLFLRLYWTLMAFGNDQGRISPARFTGETFSTVPRSELIKVRDEVLKSPAVLERFLAENPARLPPEHLELVAPWRRCLSGPFLVLKHLQKYSVFMNEQPPVHLYGVGGLNSSFAELVRAPLPLRVAATLVPWRERIVVDGLVASYAIQFGPGYRSSFNAQYAEIKRSEGITERLDGAPAPAKANAHKPVPANLGPQLAQLAALTDKLPSGGEPQHTAVLSLLRASAKLATAVFNDPNEQRSRLTQLRRALTQLERALT